MHTCTWTHIHTILTTQVSVTALQTVTKNNLRSDLFRFTVAPHHERRQELRARTKTETQRSAAHWLVFLDFSVCFPIHPGLPA